MRDYDASQEAFVSYFDDDAYRLWFGAMMILVCLWKLFGKESKGLPPLWVPLGGALVALGFYWVTLGRFPWQPPAQ
jgi:hypothetical protein